MLRGSSAVSDTSNLPLLAMITPNWPTTDPSVSVDQQSSAACDGWVYLGTSLVAYTHETPALDGFFPTEILLVFYKSEPK